MSKARSSVTGMRILFAGLCAIAAHPAHAATIIVDGTSDLVAVDGKVGLREALLSINAQVDRNTDVTARRTGVYGTSDRVVFMIATGAPTIALGSPLPAITRPIEIDGTQQPGFVSSPVLVIDGAAAGPTATGLSLRSSALLQAIELRNFGGTGVSVGTSLLQDGFEDGATAIAATGVVTASNVVVRNGGDGVGIEADGALVLTNARILGNARVGIDVRGALDASGVEIGFNLGHGVRVETAQRVRLQDADVHHSGGDGAAPAPPPFVEETVSLGSIGVLVLRASHAEGFALRGILGKVHHNIGHGIQLGDAVSQSGVVRGLVADAQIYMNQLGIRVLQKDDATRTYSTIVANNIHQNRSFGMHLSTSYQLSLDGNGLEYIARNDVHRNGVTGTGCSVESGASQNYPQVLFDGVTGGSDLTAPEPPGEVFGWGPDRAEYPQDYRCYWGSDAPNLPSSEKTATPDECALINNPSDVYLELSQGMNNRCVWLPGPGQCRLGWDIGGVETFNACTSGPSRNRIFGYVNAPARN